jgi:hypothetical protein
MTEANRFFATAAIDTGVAAGHDSAVLKCDTVAEMGVKEEEILL